MGKGHTNKLTHLLLLASNVFRRLADLPMRDLRTTLACTRQGKEEEAAFFEGKKEGLRRQAIVFFTHLIVNTRGRGYKKEEETSRFQMLSRKGETD